LVTLKNDPNQTHSTIAAQPQHGVVTDAVDSSLPDSEVRRAARSGVWFAAIKGVTQILSWAATVVVARLLSPADYGLLTIATVATGYIEVFSELGLGAAIVQRPSITQREYSSTFWLSISVGAAFGIAAFALAYPTAWVFGEPRVIPITQTVSVLFLLGAAQTVPYNMLVRDLRFKELGIAQLMSVALCTPIMLLLASQGYGVWTLVVGTFVSRTAMLALVFAFTRWRPSWHYKWDDVRGSLKFGVSVAAGRSVFFLFQKSDVFLVGALLGTQAVGFYSFAVHLANLPADKVATVVHQMAFPLFAKFQTDISRLRDLYLKLTKVVVLVVAPLFMAGTVWGDEIVRGLLGEKWTEIIPIFRALCLVQLVSSLTIINGPLHTAFGEARRVWIFYGACVPLMSAGIYAAAPYGLNAVIVPWLIIYPLLCIGWTWFTLRQLSMNIHSYLRIVIMPVAAALTIAGLSKVCVLLLVSTLDHRPAAFVQVLLQLSLSTLAYAGYLWRRESETLAGLWSLRRADNASAM